MDDFWLRLPGPVRLVEEMCRDACAGSNVYLSIPEELRTFVLAPVGDSLWDAGIGRNDIDARAGNGTNPIDCLRNYVEPDTRSSLRSPRDVAACPALNGFFFLVHCDDEVGRSWSEFVNQYSAAIHAQNRNGHAVFCLVSAGEWKGVRDNVFVTVRKWSDYFTYFECEMYAMYRRANRKDPAWINRLTASLIAGVAQGDPFLAEHLTTFNLEQLLSPDDMVRECRKAGLSTRSGITEHTAESITRCIWKAQVREIFPLLEELRHDLISRARKELSLMSVLRGRVLEEIELGELRYHLRNSGSGSYARTLSEMRNHLAHLDIVPYRELQDPKFSRRSAYH